jgi:hypothetical protein
MADIGIYSVESRLIASVCIHETPCIGQTRAQLMKTFREQFSTKIPRKAILIDWKKGAFAIERVETRQQSG